MERVEGTNTFKITLDLDAGTELYNANGIRIVGKTVDEDAFYTDVFLCDLIKEIKANYPFKVDSDTAISVYYDILSENENFIPRYYKEKYQCNGQERYRVGNRNVWSSNAFHPDGLAHQKGIIAYKEINENKKGSGIVYKGDSDYVN